MSALDAIHTEDGHTKNYSQGITALAQYIDEQLQTDHAALSGLIGRLKEDIETALQAQEEYVDQAFADLEDPDVLLRRAAELDLEHIS